VYTRTDLEDIGYHLVRYASTVLVPGLAILRATLEVIPEGAMGE